VYKDQNFKAIAIDVWNGSTSQVQNFKINTGITYPICLNGSSLKNTYKVNNDYSIIVDKTGIIRYGKSGTNISEITSKIEELLNEE